MILFDPGLVYFSYFVYAYQISANSIQPIPREKTVPKKRTQLGIRSLKKKENNRLLLLLTLY
jgi:hypothetical protein